MSVDDDLPVSIGFGNRCEVVNPNKLVMSDEFAVGSGNGADTNFVESWCPCGPTIYRPQPAGSRVGWGGGGDGMEEGGGRRGGPRQEGSRAEGQREWSDESHHPPQDDAASERTTGS